MKPRTLIYYGKSGIGKTANLKMIAKWFYDKYKLKVRMIHGDGGGYRPFTDSDNLIGRGIVEVFDHTNREFALADIHRLADGYWPDSRGELYRDDKLRLNKKSEVGAYLIEGVTSLAENLLSHFSDQLVSGPVGFRASYIYQEQEYALGGMDRGHFGIVQRELHKLIVKKFGQLPIKLVVWTAKPRLAIDRESGGDAAFGPEGAGVADTTRIPSWFENCLHIDRAMLKKGDKVEEIRIAWYQQHDVEAYINGVPKMVPCLAKSSCPAERYPEMLSKFPKGFVRLGFDRGIDKYLEFLESMDETDKGEK
jgi:hypothetical protein